MDVDRSIAEQHLALAEEHVALGEQLIAEQRERIAAMSVLGQDVTEAMRLLDNFLDSQKMHLEHRDRLRRDLDVPGADV